MFGNALMMGSSISLFSLVYFLLVKHFRAIHSYNIQAYRTPFPSSLLFRLDFVPSAWPLVEMVPPAGCLPRPRFFRPS